jgi:hypothetical protein
MIGPRGAVVFVGGNPEEQDGSDSIAVSGNGFGDEFFFGELEHAGHAGHGDS